MTESQKNKKSRRRFLADALFVGGGITAAALLAKGKFLGNEPAPPQVMGAIQAPMDPKGQNCQTPDQTQETPHTGGNSPSEQPPEPPPTEGEAVPTGFDGDYDLPTDLVQPPSQHSQDPDRVMIAGKPVAPRTTPSPDKK